MYAGIDIGSQSTDVVIIDDKKNILSYSILYTGASHQEVADKALLEACSSINCDVGEIKCVVGTGYGRKNIKNAIHQVTEISCHAKGANYFFPNVRTILDIGGQDSKVIKIDSDGKVLDFLMNEKCAAGTGRFLEVMARVLEVQLADFGELALASKEQVELSSMCTVFAESEVISKIADGKKKEDIINGIHNSICDRVGSMIERMKLENDFAMTGGVAKNKGIVNTLKMKLITEVNVPNEPQIVGALGAALFAYEKSNK